MKKAVIESSLKLIISVIIIVFIVSIGFFEINGFLSNRGFQLFSKGVNDVIASFDFLMDSNAVGSFLQVDIIVPLNQSVIFDNYTDELVLNGFFAENISLNVDLVNFLSIDSPGSYTLTLCYNCSADKEFLVVFE